jgi:predicted SnoaL-like aldol condensation-catalyzing enzyme
MKQLFFAIVVMGVFCSCESKVTGKTEGDHSTIADRNADNTNKVFRAIESGNVAGLDTIFTEDFIDHNAGPEGQDIKGRDSVIAMLGQIHTFFDGLKMEMMHHATSADGQYHYATVRMTGTAKENSWGIPVGMKMDDISVDVIKIKDGKAAEHWGFMSMQDHNEIMASMHGAASKPSVQDSAK